MVSLRKCPNETIDSSARPIRENHLRTPFSKGKTSDRENLIFSNSVSNLSFVKIPTIETYCRKTSTEGCFSGFKDEAKAGRSR